MNTNMITSYQARLSLLLYVGICLTVGQTTAYWANAYFGHDWDKNLIKPSVTQFNWVFFVVVWTVNYTTMGIAAWYVRQSGQYANVTRALRWFWFQFMLCLLWVPVVQSTNWVGSAVIMDFVVGLPAFITGYWFYKTSRRGSVWFIPYLLWTVITTHAKIWMYWLNT